MGQKQTRKEPQSASQSWRLAGGTCPLSSSNFNPSMSVHPKAKQVRPKVEAWLHVSEGLYSQSGGSGTDGSLQRNFGGRSSTATGSHSPRHTHCVPDPPSAQWASGDNGFASVPLSMLQKRRRGMGAASASPPNCDPAPVGVAARLGTIWVPRASGHGTSPCSPGPDPQLPATDVRHTHHARLETPQGVRCARGQQLSTLGPAWEEGAGSVRQPWPQL